MTRKTTVNPFCTMEIKIEFESKTEHDILKAKAEDVLSELNIKDYRILYKSRYNNYVVYNHAPFCIDGFDMIISMEEDEDRINFMKFAEYLIRDFNDNVRHLENCLQLQEITK